MNKRNYDIMADTNNENININNNNNNYTLAGDSSPGKIARQDNGIWLDYQYFVRALGRNPVDRSAKFTPPVILHHYQA